jgi:hypothetical protein
MYVHASDWAQNLATLTNFDIDSFTQIGGGDGSIATIQNTHTVTFVMTDGDNIQWLLNDFTTSNGKINCSVFFFLNKKILCK